MVRVNRAFLFGALALFGACGGGGGSGNSSVTGAPAAITTTGTISAFGSIYVNGNHFDISQAQITLDDQLVTQADLRVGQRATVRGQEASGGGLAMAESVEVHTQVQGPVASVDMGHNRFVVLGQTVNVTPDSSFDPTISPADITGITVGAFVQVHGMPAADGSISATRIGLSNAAAGLRVSGTVAGVDTMRHTFMINALTVDYSGATLDGFMSGQPANGDVVRVKGTVFDSVTTTLTATHVARVNEGVEGTSGTVELEGLVTRFASIMDFDIAGHPVTTTSSTVYENGTSADVALNAELEARGTVNSSGVLVASVIEIHHRSVLGIEGQAANVNATAGTFTLLGVTIEVNTQTRFEDKSSAELEMFSLSDVHTGDSIAVVGYESPAGSGKILATRLERLPPTSMVGVSGPFSAATAPQFLVFGLNVDASGATFYGGDHQTLTSAEFFAQAVGKLVVAVGTLNGSTIMATQVALLPQEGD